MKILVFSDSHGNLRFMEGIIKETKNVDIIFHLGDNVKDAKKAQELTDIPVIYVKGNCDYEEKAPLYLVEEIKDTRIFLTHGHTYAVNSEINILYYTAKENNVDLVLFGHTHKPFKEEIDGITFFNPGSIGDKRWQPKESYGIIEIDEKNLIKLEIIEVE